MPKLTRLAVVGARHRMVSAELADGSTPALAFFNDLASDAQRAGLLERMRRFADAGVLPIPEQLNDLRDGIREFKMATARLLFYHADHRASGLVVLTHGFVKATQRTPRGEIDRALWIRNQIEGGT